MNLTCFVGAVEVGRPPPGSCGGDPGSVCHDLLVRGLSGARHLVAGGGTVSDASADAVLSSQNDGVTSERGASSVASSTARGAAFVTSPTRGSLTSSPLDSLTSSPPAATAAALGGRFMIPTPTRRPLSRPLANDSAACGAAC